MVTDKSSNSAAGSRQGVSIRQMGRAVLLLSACCLLSWQAALTILEFGEALTWSDESNSGPQLFASSEERLQNSLGDYFSTFRRLEELIPDDALIVRENPASVFGAEEGVVAPHLFALQLRHLLYPRIIRNLEDPVGAIESADLGGGKKYYLLRLHRGDQLPSDSAWKLLYSDANCELFVAGGD